MTKQYEYELKLYGGKVVTWPGSDGVNAAHRYADAHRGDTVLAFREVKTGVYPYNPDINDIVE